MTQKNFIDKYRQKTISMRDFTIRVSNLPADYAYGFNEDILKAHLMIHFENQVKLGLAQKYKSVIGYNPHDHSNEYQIADICFARKEVCHMELIEEVSDINN